MIVDEEIKVSRKPKVVEQHIESSESEENESTESGDDIESGDDMGSGSETNSLITGQNNEQTKSKKQINSDSSIKTKLDELNRKSEDNIKHDNDIEDNDCSRNSSEFDSDENSDISDMDDSFDSGGEGDAESDEENENSGTGLGAVMSSILKTQKNKDVILSKAKKDYEIRQKERESDNDFEVVEEGGTIKKVKKYILKEDTTTRIETEKEIMLRRKEWENINRVWPDVQADREKERKLRILATQGVVQLLGAIDKHAKSVNKRLSEARGELQRDKVLETTGKEAFMEVLRQEGVKVNKSNTQTSEIKTEVKEEPDERILLPEAKKPRWGVLSDNFYQEPTLDGWDKESDEE